MTISLRMQLSWHNPKTQRQQASEKGVGLFANAPIAKGELLCAWGGAILTDEELPNLPDFALDRTLQIEEGLHISSGLIDDDADCVNHSCDPTGGVVGQITLVARRDIAAGEEITFDYAMTDSSPHMDMECFCGQPNCRKLITSNDWKLPELQERYKGYFSPYLQRRIDKLREKSAQ